MFPLCGTVIKKVSSLTSTPSINSSPVFFVFSVSPRYNVGDVVTQNLSQAIADKNGRFWVTTSPTLYRGDTENTKKTGELLMLGVDVNDKAFFITFPQNGNMYQK